MSPIALHHRVDGSGPPVVLLHPVGLDLTCFDELVATLSPRFTLLRPDLRGHGGSPLGASPPRVLPMGTGVPPIGDSATPAAIDLDDYAADLYALLARLDWPPSAIVGFSFGGMVAQAYALRYPAAVRALVIAACASTFPPDVRPTIAARGAAAREDGMSAIVEPTLTRWFSAAFRARGGDAAIRARLLSDDVDGWATAWRVMAGLDTAPRLSGITAPTLCLAGEQDLSAPPSVLEAIAARIPGARLEIVPEAPHMLFLEQPALVAAALTRFLTSIR